MDQRSKNTIWGILDPEVLYGERVQVENLKCCMLTSSLVGYKHSKVLRNLAMKTHK